MAYQTNDGADPETDRKKKLVQPGAPTGLTPPAIPATPVIANPAAGGGGGGMQPPAPAPGLVDQARTAIAPIVNAATNAIEKAPPYYNTQPKDFQPALSPPDAEVAAYRVRVVNPAEAKLSRAREALGRAQGAVTTSHDFTGITGNRVDDASSELDAVTPHLRELESNAAGVKANAAAQAELSKIAPDIQLPPARPVAYPSVAGGIDQKTGKPTGVAKVPNPIPGSAVKPPDNTFARTNPDGSPGVGTAPAGIAVTRDAKGNPVFTGTGGTVAAAGNQAIANPAAAAAGQQPTRVIERPAPIQAQRYDVAGNPTGQVRGNDLVARNDAYDVTNPRSPAFDIVTKLEGLASDPSLKGSPSTRRAVAEALLGSLAAANGATAETQRASNAGVQDNTNQTTTANAAFASSNQAAQTDTARNNLAADSENSKAALEIAKPDYHVGADGTTYAVGRDRIARPVLDEKGKPLKSLTQQGAAEAKDQLDNLQKRHAANLAALATMKADDPKRALMEAENQQLSTRMDALTGGGQQAAGGPSQGAIDKLKANPKLAADFDAKYGAGSSTQYLGK